MRIKIQLLLVSVIFPFWRSGAQNQDAGNPVHSQYTRVQLKEDFVLLRRALEEAHPALYQYTSKTSTDSLFGSIEGRLKDGMDGQEFYRLLVPVFGSIKCGHTRIAPSPGTIRYIGEKARIAPFDIRIIDKRFYVFRNFSSDSSLAKGTEILSVNGIPVPVLLEKLMQNAFTDGRGSTMKYRLIENEFFLFYFLSYGETGTFRLETLHPITQVKRTITLEAGAMKDRKRQPRPLMDFRMIEDKAVLTLRTFDKARLERANLNYNRYIDSVFSILKQKNIPKLIVDIRGNDGGDPTLFAHLCRQFAAGSFHLLNYTEFKTDKRLEYFGDPADTAEFYRFKKIKGRYYWYDTENDWYGTYEPVPGRYKGTISLLTDGGSFSSGGFLASLFSYYKFGKIAGEESGGANCCNDCHASLLLPNTNLVVQVARCRVTMNLEGMSCRERGIFPDEPVELSVEDLINGKDTVLEFALRSKE